MEKPAIFKGSKEGIVLVVNPESPFNEVIDFLNKTFEERKLFFSGASVILNPNGRLIAEEELGEMADVFARYGLSFKIMGEEKVYGKEVIASRDLNEEKVALIPNTIRSGQAINFDGSIVVLGDINEGAEINVSKSVYVFGIIRGIVNAGESVVSLGFQPLRMTIGKKQLGKELSDKTYRKPRIAKIENGEVVFKVVGEKQSLRRRE